MIHTVNQFIMEGGKMKKLHFSSKNQNVAFNMVEMAGVEPASESTLTGLSPGADDYCGSLTLPVPLPDGKPSRRQVR